MTPPSVPSPSSALTLSAADAIKVLNSISLGSAVAEHDSLLYEARVETNIFAELFRDKVDLVAGTKGSGKTSLYRLISEYLSNLLLKNNVAVLTGVEAAGDPVFQAFRAKLEQLSETEFEVFWRIYFVSLIRERFLKASGHEEHLAGCKKEKAVVEELCKRAKIPEATSTSSLKDIIQKVLTCVRVRVLKAGADPEGADVTLLEFEPTGETPTQDQIASAQLVFLNEIHEAIVKVLEKANLRVWILLDRLDEVFPRRSKLERTALRALLRTTRSFHTAQLRIKLFLRDDIFENVVLSKDGFTALSHIEARRAPTLRWGPDDIRLMVIKRMAANPRIRALYKVNQAVVDEGDFRYVSSLFDKIFPPQVKAGKNQSATLDWIYHHCADGRGVVTPRDVLDLLDFAIKAQVRHLKAASTPPQYLIGPLALKEAHTELSVKKCRVYLEAEFPEFWSDIKKFQNSKTEHNSVSLERLLGAQWKEKSEDLISIGFLRLQPQTKTYIVPFVFRPGLGVKQGKAFNNHH